MDKLLYRRVVINNSLFTFTKIWFTKEKGKMTSNEESIKGGFEWNNDHKRNVSVPYNDGKINDKNVLGCFTKILYIGELSSVRRSYEESKFGKD